MPVRAIKDEDLENEDENINHKKTSDEEKETSNDWDSEGGDEWGEEEFVDIEAALDDLKAIVEETIGLSFDEETFELLALSTPAIVVACGDGALKKKEMEILSDTILYAYYGDEDYEALGESGKKNKIAGLSKVIVKLVENFEEETDYGTLHEALLDLAADLSMDEGADEFIRYTLHEVAASDGRMAMGTSETLEEVCELLGYDVDEILQEYDSEGDE